jgi:hypothetical protein
MTGRGSTPQRTPVLLDAATGRLRMGAAERRVDDPADREQLYGAYLSLLYAVRGGRRGKRLPLRAADLDALLAIVGDDPDRIEQRLVELMGCSAEDASLLRRVLLRHRALTASVGMAAGISAFALVGPSAADSVLTPAPEASYSVPADTVEQPPLETYATTDDGEHVAPPEQWELLPDGEAAPAPVAEHPPAAVRTTAVEPNDAHSHEAETPALAAATAPTAARAQTPTAPPTVTPTATVPEPATAPVEPTVQAEAEAPAPDVVLGEPTAPIDRPGSWIAEPTGREDEVVLGEPTAPIDRPGSWISEPTGREDEVVLGEPTGPIDREGSWIHPPGTGDDGVVLG